MGGRRRVLVVDDEADLCALLQVYLAQHDIEVVGVGTIADALDELDGADVLLTDFSLPDGDGVSLVEQARARHPAIPAVVMSALVESQRCSVAGIHLVPKPFGLQEVAAVLLDLSGERPVPA